MQAELLMLMLKGMGIDPAQFIGQIQGIGTLLARCEARLEALEKGMVAIQTVMGIYVPPNEETAKLIAAETDAHLARFGGAAEQPGETVQ